MDEQHRYSNWDFLETQRLAHIGTWRLDLAAWQVTWSEELYKLHGLDPQGPPPTYAELQGLFTPESWERFAAALDRNRIDGIPYELELNAIKPDGTIVTMWVRGEAERAADGTIVGIWGVFQDISDRKRSEEALRESEERFQLLFNKAPLGYQSLDSNGCFIDVNQKWLDTFDYKKDEVIGKWFGDFLFPEYVEGFRERFCLFKAQGAIHSEFEMRTKDGRRIHVAFEGKIGYDNEGNFKQTHCILQDITDQRKAEKALRDSNELFTSLLKLLPVGVFMVDAIDGHPMIANDMGKYLLGRGILPEATENTLSEVYQAYRKDTMKHYPTSEMPIVLGMKGISAHIDDMVVEHPDGAHRLLEVFGCPVNDKDGKPYASLVTFMDITERKKAEEDLLYLSYHDTLTGFYNRRFFELKIQSIDNDLNLPISIIICDVNGLKLINDSFGHTSGDKLLTQASEIIRSACRPDDCISRIGGDEFAILLPRTDEDEASRIVKNIKQLASQRKVENIEVSIAVGHDTKTSDKQSIVEVLANAENHMYRHKLYERTSAKSKTIEIIMNTLFAKSDRESMHSDRVSFICLAIASKMNFDKDEINKIRMAGLVHDIGKIGIDENILNKPGKLTPEEREQINKHPEVGWRILSSSNEFSELANFILNHHERWDGTGYPNGLQAESIPVEARIISVADSYDAMTRYRTYRPSLTQKEAIVELKRCAGTQFDPKIVNIFIDQVLPDEDIM